MKFFDFLTTANNQNKAVAKKMTQNITQEANPRENKSNKLQWQLLGIFSIKVTFNEKVNIFFQSTS